MLLGDAGSRGLVDFGSKVQPSVARSSGEAESTHVGEVAKGLSDSPITQQFFFLFFENNGPRANARPPANSDSKEKA